MLDHLGLGDWVRLPQGADVDLIGPIAAEGLRRHGLLSPGNAHVVVPIAQARPGAAVIAGFAGDDVFGRWPAEGVADVLARRISADAAGSPRSWSARMHWLSTRRKWLISHRATMLLAAGERAAVHAPLGPGFFASLARAGGRLGWVGRTAAMEALCGALQLTASGADGGH